MLDDSQRLIYYSIISNGSIRNMYQLVYEDLVLNTRLHELEITSSFPRLAKRYDGQPHINQYFYYQQLKQLTKENITPITILDATYPTLLKFIANPPLVLYIKGNVEILKQTMISVVGTRIPSPRSGGVLNKLLPPFLEKDFVLVSGLALGIDTKVHQLCLRKHGSTIGVLAGGFHHLYPKGNIRLAEQMEREHLLITEYPPEVPTAKWRFIERNRIISGLSHITIVIEAKKRSGSLITAAFALEQSRDVYAVPGCILDEQSEGSHQLIQQGATLLYNPDELIEQLLIVR